MSDSPDEIPYATWGERFFTTAVTTERVLAGINVLAGQPIDVGPMGVGPRKIVKVRATGSIGQAQGRKVGDAPVSFEITLPVSLEFVIDLGLDKHRFTAEIVVPLAITARSRSDLAIVLDVVAPTASQVRIDLRAQGLRASLTQHAANVEGELRRFVAKYVARELDKPYVAAARLIDVSGAIDKAISTLGPRQPDPDDVVADFDEALAAEIDSSPTLFADPELFSER
ncbi:hypothetical protein [Nocardioides sp. R-C-SC26]|uniref:hypothetical protein n=1 Tax=Nocardioides sp. R-C-SC26 TaxID=2870414 RepID=UPI001E377D1E|nr:hypothetical protein [Nocardioides sp. R-C-SC26]